MSHISYTNTRLFWPTEICSPNSSLIGSVIFAGLTCVPKAQIYTDYKMPICMMHAHARTHARTHTHTFNGPFPGLPRWASTRKVKPIWILLNQETVSGSGISWAICKSAPRSRQITMPTPHHSVFYRPDALPAAQPIASKHWRVWCMQCGLITSDIYIYIYISSRILTVGYKSANYTHKLVTLSWKGQEVNWQY